MSKALLLVAAVIVLTAEVALSASDAEVDQALTEAQELFHRASNTDSQEAASELYRRALQHYEFAVHQGDVANGRLFYNIANAYYRIGDLGNAMLYYRRAELLRPADPNIAHNLRQIRSERPDVLPPPDHSGLATAFLFWHLMLSSNQKALALAVALSAASVAAGLFVLRRAAWQRVAAICAAAVALLFLGSITVDELGVRGADDAVITDSEVIARKGDGTAYEPAFVDPLHAATEITVIERRGEWIRVRLTDGRSAWLPSDSVTPVRPLTGDTP